MDNRCLAAFIEAGMKVVVVVIVVVVVVVIVAVFVARLNCISSFNSIK